ncbi:MAG: hypothetical protein AAGL49_10825 [Pseudomonadota bacterium]
MSENGLEDLKRRVRLAQSLEARRATRRAAVQKAWTKRRERAHGGAAFDPAFGKRVIAAEMRRQAKALAAMKRGVAQSEERARVAQDARPAPEFDYVDPARIDSNEQKIGRVKRRRNRSNVEALVKRRSTPLTYRHLAAAEEYLGLYQAAQASGANVTQYEERVQSSGGGAGAPWTDGQLDAMKRKDRLEARLGGLAVRVVHYAVVEDLTAARIGARLGRFANTNSSTAFGLAMIYSALERLADLLGLPANVSPNQSADGLLQPNEAGASGGVRR